MNGGDLADRTGAEPRSGRSAAHGGEIAPILHDRVQPPDRGLRTRDEIARLRERLGHRLFAEDVAAGAEARCHHAMPRGGNHDVE